MDCNAEMFGIQNKYHGGFLMQIPDEPILFIVTPSGTRLQEPIDYRYAFTIALSAEYVISKITRCGAPYDRVNRRSPIIMVSSTTKSKKFIKAAEDNGYQAIAVSMEDLKFNPE